MQKVACLLFFIVLFTGCSTREEIVYFENAEELNNVENLLNYEPVIQQNDVLQINVSSMDEELAAPFQMKFSGQQGGGGGNRNSSLRGYLVDVEGNIKFPQLDKVSVAGKTRTEIEEMLQSRIREYVTDAVVSVRIMNFSVTVLGEVGSPGRVQVTDGRLTMPELIAMAGEINYTGKRENILIIREVDGVKSIGSIDMTETDLFLSPYYYLKQNDLVYVEPTYRQVKSAGFITSWQGLISILTTAFSLYLLFSR